MTGKLLLLTFLFGLVIGQSAISAWEPGNGPQANEDYDGDYYDDESIEMYHEKAELKAVTAAKEVVQVVVTTTTTTASVNVNATKITEESKNMKEGEFDDIKTKPETQQETETGLKSEDDIPPADKKETDVGPKINTEFQLPESGSDEQSGRVISLAGDEMGKDYDAHYYDDAMEQNVFVEKIHGNNDRQTVDVNSEAESETGNEKVSENDNDNVFGHRFIFTTARTDTIFSGIFIGFLALTLATVLFAFYRGLVWFNHRMKTEIVYERMEQGGEPVFRQ